MDADTKRTIYEVVGDFGTRVIDGLSPEAIPDWSSGLGRLFAQQGPIEELVEDVRAGVADSLLMDKYGLSPVGLKRALRRVTELGLITEEEADFYSSLDENTVRPYIERRHRRTYPGLTASVISDSQPDKRGIVRDISENGLCVVGLDTRPGETDTFSVVEHEFSLFSFQGACRWVVKDRDSRETVAGLEITEISDEDLRELMEWAGTSAMGFDDEDDHGLPW